MLADEVLSNNLPVEAESEDMRMQKGDGGEGDASGMPMYRKIAGDQNKLRGMSW
jgi:hypothetical protein